jgi:hypothetical protein
MGLAELVSGVDWSPESRFRVDTGRHVKWRPHGRIGFKNAVCVILVSFRQFFFKWCRSIFGNMPCVEIVCPTCFGFFRLVSVFKCQRSEFSREDFFCARDQVVKSAKILHSHSLSECV